MTLKIVISDCKRPQIDQSERALYNMFLMFLVNFRSPNYVAGRVDKLSCMLMFPVNFRFLATSLNDLVEWSRF